MIGGLSDMTVSAYSARSLNSLGLERRIQNGLGSTIAMACLLLDLPGFGGLIEGN